MRFNTESTRRATVGVGAVATAGLVVWLSTWTGQSGIADTTATLPTVLAESLPFALLWAGAAWGYGRVVRRWLLPDAANGWALEFGLGAGVLLILDAALGALGILQAGHGIAAWLLIAGGAALALVMHGRLVSDEAPLDDPSSTSRRSSGLPAVLGHWSIWLAAPACAVLVVAACSAPGWLWASEFDGYDALSYHLQLPKEWLAAGRIEPVEHNVYSFFPGYVEAAYYHLMILRGNALAAVYAAQLLHAFVAIATALATASLLTRARSSTRLAGASAVLVLGTSWVVVVGSLAYDEMFVALFLACGLQILQSQETPDARSAGALGLLAGAAIGAKLTAIGFVAAPLAILLLSRLGPRRWFIVLSVMGGAALVALGPYLVRNVAHGGNPVFPFATQLFGSAHWTDAQAAVWQSAHTLTGGLADRFSAVWNQLLRYGIGPSPLASTEPWKPQWSILFWLALAGGALGLLTRSWRLLTLQLLTVLALQLAFWLMFTHVQSRFMLPAVVPAAVLATIGLDVICGWFEVERGGQNRFRAKRFAVHAVSGALLLLWACQPMALYRGERAGAPSARLGLGGVWTGATLTSSQRFDLATRNPTVFINYFLPAEARILFVGEAAPLYYLAEFTYQTTWDRGPFSQAMRASDDPADWIRFLRERGFTHLLIDANMLTIWEQSGWNDRKLTAERVVSAAENHATLIRVFGERGALRLYRL